MYIYVTLAGVYYILASSAVLVPRFMLQEYHVLEEIMAQTCFLKLNHLENEMFSLVGPLRPDRLPSPGGLLRPGPARESSLGARVPTFEHFEGPKAQGSTFGRRFSVFFIWISWIFIVFHCFSLICLDFQGF